MVNALGGAVYFFIALGILVTIHELGHFTAARLCGVKVLRFSLGFGPILYKRTAKDGCEYALSAIPLGGYVKMEGENTPNEETDKTKLSKTSFKAQSVLKRAIIIFAGPFSNIILAVLLLTGVNMSGIVERYAIVGDVIPQSIADKSGFKVYDKIDFIDDKQVNTWSDFLYEAVENIGDSKKVLVKVSSDFGKGQTRELFLSFEDLSLNRDESPIEKLGLRICFGKITNTLGAVLPNSPAHKAGLQVGDVIEQINGQKVDSWYRIQDSILSSNFAPLNLVVSRSGSKYSASVQPESKYNEHTKKSVPFVGIGPKGEEVDGLDRVVKYGFTDAVYKAVSDSVTMSKLVLVSAYKLINGSISADNISGPITIAKGAQESASFGLAIFISFLAAISVNLGILNLLPIPVLDGGQLIFLAYEAIMRREPSAKTQAALTAVGAAVLLTLMIFAIFNDIKGL